MIKLRQVNFQSIMKMSMSKRLQAFKGVTSDRLSFTMFSALTPTQFAELFPKAYRDSNPDISGFMKALPTSLTAAQQTARENQLAQTASGMSGADFDSRGYVKQYKDNMQKIKSAHVGGGYVKPPPQLTPEQQRAFEYLRSGDNPVNSGIMQHTFGNLTDSQLAEIGISKRKDDKGNMVFHYESPTMTDEQATARLKTSGPGTGNSKFSQIAPKLMDDLKSRYGLTTEEAAVVLGNLGHESTGMTAFSEGGGGPGRGWAQWTSPDRKAGFFQYAKNHGLDPRSDEASRGYLFQELDGKYAHAIRALKAAQGRESKMIAFEDKFESAGIKHYASRFNYMDKAMSIYNNREPIQPQGPNGHYSKEQLDKAKEDYYKETNQARQQKLASFLQNQGVDVSSGGPQGSVSFGKTKDFSSFILGTKGHCQTGARTLASHMFGTTFGAKGNANEVGPSGYYQNSGFFKSSKIASRDDLSNQAYLDSLPIGTVISVGGGKAGHVQIKIGPNRWASDHDQGNKVYLHRGSRDGYPDYDGKFYVSIPNEAGLKQLKANGVEQNYSEAASEKIQAEPTEGPRVSKQSGPPPDEERDSSGKIIKKSEQPIVSNDKPVEQINLKVGENVQPIDKAKVTVDGKPVEQPTPGVGPSTMSNAPQAPGTERINMKAGENVQPEAAAQVSVTKKEAPAPNKFKVNSAGLIAAIKNTDEFKNTFGSSFATDSMILNGFANDERVRSAGVSYNPETGTLTMKDPNNPLVKQVMSGMDTKSFMSPIEEKKKAEKEKSAAATPSPAAPPPAPTPPKTPAAPTATPNPPAPSHPGQGKTGASGTPGGGGGKGKDGEPGKSDAETAKPVPTASKGGDFNVGSQDLIAKPIGSLNGDNVIVGSKEGNPMFTMKSTEDLTVKDGVASVRPKSKESNVGPLPPREPMIDMSASAADNNPGLKVKPSVGAPDQVSAQYSPNDLANQIAEASKPIARNETAYRAFARVNFTDTGSPIGGHYTYGDQNLS